MSKDLNDIDKSQESLINSFIYWGMRAKLVDENESISFKAICTEIEPPNKIVESTIVHFVLSSIDIEDEELSEEIMKDAHKDYPIPIDSLKEVATETEKKILKGNDLIEELEFVPFKSREQLLLWSTDYQRTQQDVYDEFTDKESEKQTS